MAQVSSDEQMGFTEKVVDDDDMVVFFDDFMETRREASETKKAHESNKKKFEDLIDREKWGIGDVVRVGPYQITITETNASTVQQYTVEARRKANLKRKGSLADA